jgi:hypothetical protein
LGGRLTLILRLAYCSLKSALCSCVWIADAHRGDGKRFVVRAEEKLTAFLELESQLAVKGMDF